MAGCIYHTNVTVYRCYHHPNFIVIRLLVNIITLDLIVVLTSVSTILTTLTVINTVVNIIINLSPTP